MMEVHYKPHPVSLTSASFYVIPTANQIQAATCEEPGYDWTSALNNTLGFWLSSWQEP